MSESIELESYVYNHALPRSQRYQPILRGQAMPTEDQLRRNEDDETKQDEQIDDYLNGEEVYDDEDDDEDSYPESKEIDSNILKALIYAIRTNLSYARSSRVANLCTNTQDPISQVIIRARNARLIMSNIVNEVQAGDEKLVPYCIWHPVTATEETYRQVADKFPSMRYQVARACAVAGYSDLYHSLDVLPDVSVAEEARQSSVASGIFESIMSKPARYAVMDDYNRSITSTPSIKGLNRDTCLYHQLSGAKSHEYWDICEDGGLDVEDVYIGDDSVGYGVHNRWLLYSPLPYDLPFCDKDVLICQAAYDGNIDRYVRLRRPMMVDNEAGCVARGVRHHTSFAKWCSIELISTKRYQMTEIRAAIHARFTMINDISWWKPGLRKEELPTMFWWPLKPVEYTLLRLSHLEPRLHVTIKQAAIACDYQRLYDELKTTLDYELIEEAGRSANRHYARDCVARKQEYKGSCSVEHELGIIERFDPEPTFNLLSVGDYVHTGCFGEQCDDDFMPIINSNGIDLLISVPDELITLAGKQEGATNMWLPLED